MSQFAAIGANDAGVPSSGIFGRAAQGLVVDVNKAEALAVSVGPLEVVHERPMEISANVDFIADRPRQLDKISATEIDSLRIVHRPIGVNPIQTGKAVLCNMNR